MFALLICTYIIYVEESEEEDVSEIVKAQANTTALHIVKSKGDKAQALALAEEQEPTQIVSKLKGE